jgi:hypothetical protein
MPRTGPKKWTRVALAFTAASTLAVLVGPNVAQAQPISDGAAAPITLSKQMLLTAGAAQGDANLIASVARRTEEASFAGVALTNKSSQVVVYLTRLEPAVETAIRAIIPSRNLDFQQRAVSEVVQQRLHASVLADAPSLAHSGIKVGLFGPDPATGREKVSVLGGTAQQLQLLSAKYGSNAEIVALPASYRAVPDGSRIGDTAPWNGGDFISDGNEDCTSGIPVHNAAGQYFLVTAAHCFALNATVYNYSSSIPLGSKVTIGKVAAQDLRASKYDAELVYSGARTSALTFTGPTATTSTNKFVTAGPARVGSTVCTSGAFEGEHCLGVISVNSCVAPAITGLPRTVCGEDYYYSSNSQSIGQGDSGAPVYEYVSGGLRAVGIHNLHDGSYQVPCTNWSSTGRICSGHGWFVDINPIASTWGLTVN